VKVEISFTNELELYILGFPLRILCIIYIYVCVCITHDYLR